MLGDSLSVVWRWPWYWMSTAMMAGVSMLTSNRNRQGNSNLTQGESFKVKLYKLSKSMNLNHMNLKLCMFLRKPWGFKIIDFCSGRRLPRAPPRITNSHLPCEINKEMLTKLQHHRNSPTIGWADDYLFASVWSQEKRENREGQSWNKKTKVGP